MEEAVMDLRAKAVLASFVALLGLLAISAYGSLHKAQPNAALNAAIFGSQD